MNNTETTFYIFTDGSSRGNPGPGGWGSIIVEQRLKIKEQNESQVTELGGREDHTTNNKMELMAAIRGLARVPKESTVTVYSDSSYVINGITKWIHGWRKNNWITSTKEQVSNTDLWKELDSAREGKKVEWTYVGGHIGVAGNERCDVIATSCADSEPIDLYKGALSNYPIPNILDISFDQESLTKKKSSSSKSSAKAYSYVSAVGGVVETHATWSECEKRVKGTKGARFKKSFSKEDEASIIASFRK
jgi:ribonuclease HI